MELTHLRGCAQTAPPRRSTAPARSHRFQQALSWEKPEGKRAKNPHPHQSPKAEPRATRPPEKKYLCSASALPLLKGCWRDTRLCQTPTPRHHDTLAGGISPGQKGFPHTSPLSSLYRHSPSPRTIRSFYQKPAEGHGTTLSFPSPRHKPRSSTGREGRYRTPAPEMLMSNDSLAEATAVSGRKLPSAGRAV